MDRRPFTEIGVSALIALICAVFFVQAWKLPPGKFEPLGSGPVPLWTAGIVIVCCLAVIIGALRSLRGKDMGQAMQAEFSGGHPMGGVLVLGLTTAYVLVLHLKLAGFGIVTFAYLALLMLGMEGFARKRIIPALILSAVAAFGAQYIFTEIFVVDLPV
ncbi:tripartite tricarboxylate transporter TctB family protein [Oceaniglobus trochenteri]|uniref:tripartite tricarboxylate transporter TctB family protein n=1 Tax=Oceaniglobus trochenteri TaxID=2763260 RepID=UPI001D001327|nr:tripartite tricarboxylate transporter TctB family protein [Oceaniglobus trochenteri]